MPDDQEQQPPQRDDAEPKALVGWFALFGRIEFTPEEEKMLDEMWASKEMEEAIKAAADRVEQVAQERAQ